MGSRLTIFMQSNHAPKVMIFTMSFQQLVSYMSQNHCKLHDLSRKLGIETKATMTQVWHSCEQNAATNYNACIKSLAKPIALESETAKRQQQTHVESILSKTGLQTEVLDTLLSWSYICLCMVARPPFVLKFITLSRCTFLRAIWRTTRRTSKCTLEISFQTPGNKVP